MHKNETIELRKAYEGERPNGKGSVDAMNIAVQEHLRLLNGWVEIAGETHGAACADAWANVKRLSEKMYRRANRYESSWRG